MQAPKNGFFYVIDRVTGEFISAKPFTKVTWATRHRPEDRPSDRDARGALRHDRARLSPGSDGAHNWHAMAWNPGAGLVYIPGQDTTGTFAWDPDFQHQMGRMNTGRPRNRPAPVDAATHPGGAPAPAPPPSPAPPAAPAAAARRGPQIVGAGGGQQQSAFLVAWDPIAQKEKWRLTFDRPGITGGTLATAGNLLFHGSNDGSFSAYTADTGRKLWSLMLSPGFANPVTYSIDGVQYVTVATGRSGEQAPGRLYTFAVDGRGAMPSMAPVPPPEDPSGINTAEAIRAEFDRVGLPDEPARALVQQLCGLSPADRCHAVPSARGRLARDGREHGGTRHAGHSGTARAGDRATSRATAGQKEGRAGRPGAAIPRRRYRIRAGVSRPSRALRPSCPP